MEALRASLLLVLVWHLLMVQFTLAGASRYCVRKDRKHGHFKTAANCPIIREIKDHCKQKSCSNEYRRYLDNSYVGKKLCCEDVHPRGIRVLETQNCGVFANAPQAIGGKEVTIMSRPWMAILMLDKSGHQRFACGGTLITERFVLTAAHCFTDQQLIFVRLGEHQISTTVDCRKHKGRDLCAPAVEDFQHEHIHLHENYKHTEIGHDDIALIKLKGSVSVKPHIRPICLPLTHSMQMRPSVIRSFCLDGWGLTENGTVSDVLLESNINQKHKENCSYIMDPNLAAATTAICGGDIKGDSCVGDSGGPLFSVVGFQGRQRFMQFGIVSAGSTNCRAGNPSLFTNVGGFMPWISYKIAAEYTDFKFP
ncbi:serine protease grass-like [Drosophila busckii]|uniref:serine protease grass-like n=1 Tax=Drosophila busckii TaxID=30019 RepID=UPI00083F4981|nr:serine protease grass-like [Drosophila busckii]